MQLFCLLLLKALIGPLQFKLAFPYFSPSAFFSLDALCFYLSINMNLVKYIQLIYFSMSKKEIPEMASVLQFFLNSVLRQASPLEISSIKDYLPNEGDKVLPVFSLKLVI